MNAEYRTTRLQGITDLTLLAPIRPGFVEGVFNPVTHAERTRRVLRVLDAVRQIAREAALQPSPFVDPVGRFRAIHFFRFGVVPAADLSGENRLFLNVTFDGGWEQYMRIIWGPLGTLLDVILLSCIDYPLAALTPFADYMKWVRRNEVVNSLFYADSPATVGDAAYLRELEDSLCRDGGRPGADLRLSALALSQPAAAVPSALGATLSIRFLKALDGLRDLFPTRAAGGEPPADQVLLRFAQATLGDLRAWIAKGLFDPGQAFDSLSPAIASERKWLMTRVEPPLEKKSLLRFSPHRVQAGIAQPFPPDVRHGVLVLLRIRKPLEAQKWLAQFPLSTGAGEVAEDGVYRNLALTYSGLKCLGVPPATLKRLPREFIEGMEARAGVLGDVRSNHPQYWRRPRRITAQKSAAAGLYGGAGAQQSQAIGPSIQPAPALPLTLSTVHVVIQLRTAGLQDDETTDGSVPLARLARLATAFDAPGTGLQVLHVQPMALNPPARGEASGRDHFGYVDGISQPSLAPAGAPATYWSDQVKPGELFLGHPNSRGDFPQAPDPLLDDGSFLVVRKLRQHPERLDKALAEAARRLRPDAGPAALTALREDFKAKIMGRRTDGQPLARSARGPNDFDFRTDAGGEQCPMQSHIRRANPRQPLAGLPTPRIARRGMSYRTPTAAGDERGVVFMAYNASIAEQFEVIQRWLSGGNSSGMSSRRSDPLLGVLEHGQRRSFNFVDDDKVVRLDLGDQPLVDLEWGLYALAPSPEALRNIGERCRPDAPEGLTHPSLDAVKPGDLDTWRNLFDNDDLRADLWDTVRRSHGGTFDAPGYGVLVGCPAEVLRILRDDGRTFSTRGYGKRMTATIGRGFLGMDDSAGPDGKDGGHREQSPEVNEAIRMLVPLEKAFDAALVLAQKQLKRLLDAGAASTGKRAAPVDVVDFGRALITGLCTEWFGLPDATGKLMKYGTRADEREPQAVALCPGDFLSVSRYVFSTHPSHVVEAAAAEGGKRVRAAVAELVEDVRSGTRKPTELVDKIMTSGGLGGDADLQARTLAGVMLGFPATVLGNLVSVLVDWNRTGKLWDLQLDLPSGEAIDSRAAEDLYGRVLLETMARAPLPFTVWRTAAVDTQVGGTTVRAGCPVIVGLGSAVAAGGDPMLMFGGIQEPTKPATQPRAEDAAHGAGAHPVQTRHVCSGQGMAMGVMLGCIVALLGAGAFSPTSDPRVLLLSAD